MPACPTSIAAFALALVLDELARHVRDLDVRVQITASCRMVLGEPAGPPQ